MINQEDGAARDLRVRDLYSPRMRLATCSLNSFENLHLKNTFKPLTPGPPTHGHAESNVLSVAHGPSAHPESIKMQRLTVVQTTSDPSTLEAVNRFDPCDQSDQ